MSRCIVANTARTVSPFRFPLGLYFGRLPFRVLVLPLDRISGRYSVKTIFGAYNGNTALRSSPEGLQPMAQATWPNAQMDLRRVSLMYDAADEAIQDRIGACLESEDADALVLLSGDGDCYVCAQGRVAKRADYRDRKSGQHLFGS